jgi:hypothetical protein
LLVEGEAILWRPMSGSQFLLPFQRQRSLSAIAMDAPALGSRILLHSQGICSKPNSVVKRQGRKSWKFERFMGCSTTYIEMESNLSRCPPPKTLTLIDGLNLVAPLCSLFKGIFDSLITARVPYNHEGTTGTACKISCIKSKYSIPGDQSKAGFD